MKKVSIFLVSIFFIALFSLSVFAQDLPQTQQECEEANAEWKIISPENDETTSICICEDKFWNGTYCLDYDEEIRCEITNGLWEKNECICENGEWIKGIGCQYIEHDNPVLFYLLVFLVVFIVILILLIIIIKGRKRK